MGGKFSAVSAENAPPSQNTTYEKRGARTIGSRLTHYSNCNSRFILHMLCGVLHTTSKSDSSQAEKASPRLVLLAAAEKL